MYTYTQTQTDQRGSRVWLLLYSIQSSVLSVGWRQARTQTNSSANRVDHIQHSSTKCLVHSTRRAHRPPVRVKAHSRNAYRHMSKGQMCRTNEIGIVCVWICIPWLLLAYRSIHRSDGDGHRAIHTGVQERQTAVWIERTSNGRDMMKRFDRRKAGGMGRSQYV